MTLKTGVLAAAAFTAWLGGSHAALHGQPIGRSVWDGVYTTEQAARGQVLYADHCGPCHGPTLTGAEAPPLAGPEFSATWNTLTLGELFERIRTSMPEDDPGKLNTQQKADVLAHMLSVGNFPAGMMELPRDGQVLAHIQFLSTKP